MSNYDLIAPIYERDMGASMPFNDASYYLDLAHQARGPVLELGCGTGRLLGPLVNAGINATGIDRSLPMLRLARQRCGATTPLIQMDIRSLGLAPRFALALLPYSLPTYLIGKSDWESCARGIRHALLPGGQVLLDAFIPKGLPRECTWQHDYARPANTGWLVRHKRIQSQPDGSNLIERRYRLRGAFDGRTLQTRELITPLSPDCLQSLGEHYFGRMLRIDYDYQPGRPRRPDSHFCSALFSID